MEKVWIEDLVEAFEDCEPNWKSYVNTESGQVVYVPLSEEGREEFSEQELKEMDEIPFLEQYLALPDQKELREFDIMEQYTQDLLNTGYQQRLFHALHNGKPFRNFRAQIRYLNLEEDYNQYRYFIFSAMARKWCLTHNLEYQVESDEIQEYLAQVEEDEKFEEDFAEFEDSLGEFEYEEEYDDYFEE